MPGWGGPKRPLLPLQVSTAQEVPEGMGHQGTAVGHLAPSLAASATFSFVSYVIPQAMIAVEESGAGW